MTLSLPRVSRIAPEGAFAPPGKGPVAMPQATPMTAPTPEAQPTL